MTQTEMTMNAETDLAAAILRDSSCMALIPGNLQGRDFLSESCRMVFNAARALERKGIIVGDATVIEWAQRNNVPFDHDVVLGLVTNRANPAGAGEYARIVHENALRRDVQKLGNALAAENRDAVPEVISKGMQALAEISSRSASRSICFRDVEPEEPKWLLKPYVQIGKGTMIQAEPGTGKTAFVCAVAAAVSTGRGFLGLTVENPGNILMLSTEDDMGILRARFEANGGNVDRLHTLDLRGGLTFDSPEIEAEVRRLKAKLLIFDPFQAFLGEKVDFHRANETRPVLVRLFEMCQRNDCACILVAHLGKNIQGKSAVTQSLGSVDIPGAMRSILHIGRNGNLPGELAAVHVKSNNAARGKTIAFSITDKGGIDFHELNDWELSDLVKSSKEKDEGLPYDQEPLVQILNKLIAIYPKGGFWSYEDLQTMGRNLFGVSPYDNAQTIRRRLEAIKGELLSQDGLLLETGKRVNKARGIRLTRYENDQGRQERLDA